MFSKFFKKQPDQSQSMNGITVNSGVVQQGQARHNLQQVQSGNLDEELTINQVEVIKQLENLEKALKASTLSQTEKDELLAYLSPAQLEASKENANKDSIGKNLKSFNEILKTINETTETGKNLWNSTQEIFRTVGTWLGVAANFWML
jgi:hypothetical protein